MSFLDAITQWDFSILQAIQSVMQNQFLDVVMKIFSYMGDSGAIWLLVAIFMLCNKKSRATGAMVICVMAAGLLIGEVAMKNIICRPRPFVTFPELSVNIIPPKSFSFPSGHSSSSFAVATVLMLRDKRFGIPAIPVAALIAFSRMYNCVHYPTDVLSGILLGILLGFMTVIIFKKTGFDKKLSRDFMYKHTPADDKNTATKPNDNNSI